MLFAGAAPPADICGQSWRYHRTLARAPSSGSSAFARRIPEHRRRAAPDLDSSDHLPCGGPAGRCATGRRRPGPRRRAVRRRRFGPLSFGSSCSRRSIGPLRSAMKNAWTCSASVAAAVDTLPDASMRRSKIGIGFILDGALGKSGRRSAQYPASVSNRVRNAGRRHSFIRALIAREIWKPCNYWRGMKSPSRAPWCR